MNELGSQISLYRKNVNMTQEELADRLGVTPQAVSKWERGMSLPDVTLLAQLCRILHCSSDSVLGIQGGDYPEARDAENGQNPFELPFRETMRTLRDCQEPLALIFGKDLTRIFTEGLGGNYTNAITACRERLALGGILMPILRIRDEMQLAPQEFMILAYHRILYRETMAQIDESTLSHMMDALYDTVLKNYDYILNRDLVRALVNNLSETYPALISGVVPEKISYGLLQSILKGLLQRGDLPCHLIKIVETAEDLLTADPSIGLDALISGIASEIEREDNYSVVMHR